MKNFIIVVVVLLIGIVGKAQNYPFPQKFYTDAKEAEFTHSPWANSFMNKYFEEITNNSANNGSELEWDAAFKHKTKNLLFFINVGSGIMRPESRVDFMMDECGCIPFKKDNQTNRASESMRAYNSWVVMGESCNSNLAPLSKVIVFSAISHNGGYVDIYFFFEDASTVQDEIESLMGTLAFIPQNDDYKGAAGLGLAYRFDYNSDNWVITKMGKDLPAYKAGIRPGDLLSAIDDYSVSKWDYYRVFENLTGDSETMVNITVERYGEFFKYKVKREAFEQEDLELISYGDFDHKSYSIIASLLICQNQPKGDLWGERITNGEHYVPGIATYECPYVIINGITGILYTFYFEDLDVTTTYIEFEIAKGAAESISQQYRAILLQAEEFMPEFKYATNDSFEIVDGTCDVAYSSTNSGFKDIKLSYKYDDFTMTAKIIATVVKE